MKAIDDILLVIVKRIWLILVIITFFVIFMFILSLVVPPEYSSTALLMPKRAVIQGTAYEDLDTLLFGINLPKPTNTYILPVLMIPSNLYADILNSPRVLDTVIFKLDLKKKFKKKTVEEAREKLKQCIRVKISKESGIVTLIVTTRDKLLSKDIALYMIHELGNVLSSQNTNVWKILQIDLHRRILTVEDSIDAVKSELERFQKANKVLLPYSFFDKIIEKYIDLQNQLIECELKKEALSSIYTPSSPYVKLLDDKINQIKKEIGNLEKSPRDLYSSPGILRASQILLNYQDIQNRLIFLYAFYKALLYEYNYAKLMAENSSLEVEILKYPEIPERKSYPRKKSFILFGLLTGIYVGLLLSFILEYIDLINKDPERRKKWQLVLKRLKRAF
ncbi:hypothetical protein DRN58_00550 [Thermococci archaeon]|nr:MAG: hypothetical protein DRN58_00550 [Thermococci archaeon]